MTFIIKYRIIAITIFAAALGFMLALVLKLGEMKWYYIIGTPLLALVIALLVNFLADMGWSKKLKERSVLVSILLSLLFVTALFFHTKVYLKGTFRFKDVNGINRTYIKGFQYTPIAIKYKNDNPNLISDEDLLFDGFGGIEGKNIVWTPASIQQTTNRFITSYCLTVIFLAALLIWILTVAYEKKYIDPGKTVEALLAEKDQTVYEKYLFSFAAKKTDEKYKYIKLHVFLSYSSKQEEHAQEIYHSLTNIGYMVFFDRKSLPKGLEYNQAIHTAIAHSDIFIFMISPDSVAPGHYTLSELKFAAEKWPAASKFLLPVMSVKTPFDQIPPYAKSVTILTPDGNEVAEVIAEVEKLYNQKNIGEKV